MTADEKRGSENFGGSFEKEASQILRASEKKGWLKIGCQLQMAGWEKGGPGKKWGALKKLVARKNGRARKVGGVVDEERVRQRASWFYVEVVSEQVGAGSGVKHGGKRGLESWYRTFWGRLILGRQSKKGEP